MDIFQEMKKRGHEQIVFHYDESTGLKCIIAIHDTTLGPALGGCRMKLYDTTQEALLDVLRLSQGMTYKCAAAGVDFGGGKAVIIGGEKEKGEAFFRAFGLCVESLQGRFITGTDLGTNPQDFIHVARETGNLVGLPVEYGGSGSTAISTAYGVYQGLKAVAVELNGHRSLEGLRIAVQGLGKVGYLLLQYLTEERVEVLVTDIDQKRVEQAQEGYRVTPVEPEEIYRIPCDIFSPNALGGVINDKTIPQLQCRAVAGSANNILAEERHGSELENRGILYAPDYVINAGGMIQGADELDGPNPQKVKKDCQRIYHSLLEIFQIRREKGVPPHRAADLMVEKRLRSIKGLKRTSI